MDPRIATAGRISVSLPQSVDPRIQFIPQQMNPQYLQPVAPQIYATSPVPLRY